MLIHKLEDDHDSSSENDYDNLCHICYENIEDTEKIATLSCGHNFHYKCILLVFKLALQKSVVASKQCPYCRTTSDYLPLIPGILPIKFIHKEYNSSGDMPIQFIPGKCKYILKRGPNSGHQCSCSIKTEDGYCKKHQKFLDAKKLKKNEENGGKKTKDNKLNDEEKKFINELYDSIIKESN